MQSARSPASIAEVTAISVRRAFVEEVGEPDVAAVIRGFAGWARLDLLGQQGGEPERLALSQIVEWATMKVEFDLI